ncbi:MAG: hypothetical protein JSW11_06675 [Candidatus Heimdallarchaeota archaeon]|nr:MAG: hypothetical protein JSW11_06675 [Candidatus Heimdallarchaeota archaeon]
MGKEEKMLTELLDKVSALEDKLTNMEFLMVQGMGTGGATPKSPALKSVSAPQAGPVEVDLAPLEKRISEIENNISEIMKKMNNLTELTSTMKTDKTQKADELISQATSLLEKGLQLTELETTMLELKDRIQEIVIQLEVANVGSSTEDVIS